MTGVTAASLALALIALAIAAWAVWEKRGARGGERASEADAAALRGRLSELERQARPVPGVDAGEKRWLVTVGGVEAPIRALPPGEWAKALSELPDFLFTYAMAKAKGEGKEALQEGELEKLTARAREWIAVSLVPAAGEEVRPDLDHLTVPEAMDAIVRISRLNGLDENLAAWFRERLHTDPPRARQDRETVRGAPQHPPGARPN